MGCLTGHVNCSSSPIAVATTRITTDFMKASILHKLEHVAERYEEVGHLLSDPDIIGNQNKFRTLSKEYSDLETIAKTFSAYQAARSDLDESALLSQDDDPDMRAMGEEEAEAARGRIDSLTAELEILLLPKDPDDGRNVILEVRAGTGGDEAAIFAGDLFRMYSRYAETIGWRVETLSANEGEHGGYKEI